MMKKEGKKMKEQVHGKDETRKWIFWRIAKNVGLTVCFLAVKITAHFLNEKKM